MTTAPGFEPVAEAFEALMASGEEIGAAFAVHLEGELVVALYGGHADRAKETPWRADTLCPVFSTGKTAVALAMAWLTDQGRLAYDQPVADLWPAFVQGGKGAVTVEQVLSHQAGLAGFPDPMEASDWFDRDLIEAKLAAMAPLWPLGEGSGYHPVTFGALADAIARRADADGRSVAGILGEAIAGPLDLDIHIGLTDAEIARAAEHRLPSKPLDLGEPSKLKDIAFGKPWATPGRRGAEAWRRAELPGVNTHASAAGLSAMMQAFARGGRIIETALVRPETIEAALEPRVSGPDQVLPFDLTFAAGVFYNDDHGFFGREPKTVGHYGIGGSCAFADPVRGLSGAFIANRLNPVVAGDRRATALIEAVYAAL